MCILPCIKPGGIAESRAKPYIKSSNALAPRAFFGPFISAECDRGSLSPVTRCRNRFARSTLHWSSHVCCIGQPPDADAWWPAQAVLSGLQRYTQPRVPCVPTPCFLVCIPPQGIGFHTCQGLPALALGSHVCSRSVRVVICFARLPVCVLCRVRVCYVRACQLFRPLRSARPACAHKTALARCFGRIQSASQRFRPYPLFFPPDLFLPAELRLDALPPRRPLLSSRPPRFSMYTSPLPNTTNSSHALLLRFLPHPLPRPGLLYLAASVGSTIDDPSVPSAGNGMSSD